MGHCNTFVIAEGPLQYNSRQPQERPLKFGARNKASIVLGLRQAIGAMGGRTQSSSFLASTAVHATTTTTYAGNGHRYLQMKAIAQMRAWVVLWP